MPEWADLWRKTGQRGLLITSYKRLDKRLREGRNSWGGGSRVPAHLVPPVPLPAKQLLHLHSLLSLGQSCHRQKKSFIYTYRVALVISGLFVTL